MREVLTIAIAGLALLVLASFVLGWRTPTFVARPVRPTPIGVVSTLVSVVVLALVLHAL
jgi:hypothetical protein